MKNMYSNFGLLYPYGHMEIAISEYIDHVNREFDHVRVHPSFLHSNTTSHKWSLGAFAEFLDNPLDKVHIGAMYVNVDVLSDRKDGSRMVLIEENGGGMNPEKVRNCMSLGHSAKSNFVGQYGNGFNTSTMLLGADVIVFSRCHGIDGDRSAVYYYNVIPRYLASNNFVDGNEFNTSKFSYHILSRGDDRELNTIDFTHEWVSASVVPQNIQSGDCRMYCLNYIECHALDMAFPSPLFWLSATNSHKEPSPSIFRIQNVIKPFLAKRIQVTKLANKISCVI